jgi:nitrogen fixation-related uncharacterized protein
MLYQSFQNFGVLEFFRIFYTLTSIFINLLFFFFAMNSNEQFEDDLYVAKLSQNISMPDDIDDEQDDDDIEETQVKKMLEVRVG